MLSVPRPTLVYLECGLTTTSDSAQGSGRSYLREPSPKQRPIKASADYRVLINIPYTFNLLSQPPPEKRDSHAIFTPSSHVGTITLVYIIEASEACLQVPTAMAFLDCSLSLDIFIFNIQHSTFATNPSYAQIKMSHHHPPHPLALLHASDDKYGCICTAVRSRRQEVFWLRTMHFAAGF